MFRYAVIESRMAARTNYKYGSYTCCKEGGHYLLFLWLLKTTEYLATEIGSIRVDFHSHVIFPWNTRNIYARK